MSRLTIIDTRRVEHEYIDDQIAAIVFAVAEANANPGGRVSVVGIVNDDSAVDIHLTWGETDGVVVTDNLAGLPR